MERVEYTRDEYAAQVVSQHYGRTPKAFVRSFGCQQNVSEAEQMRGVLLDIGYDLTERPDDADLILFNTCAVREHAEQRVYGNIGALKNLKQQRSGVLIGICGCMSQQKTVVDKLRESYPYVDMVLGTNAADLLPQMIVEKLTTRRKALRMPAIREDIVENMPACRQGGLKAFLPIMYGCDNFCSFCVVPYVRGRERSRTAQDILHEFTQLVEQGYKEITLLGQNVNSYGKGLGEGLDFSDLLQLLCEVPGEYRVRFMTSHPKDATRKMIDTMAANDHLCKHLHLPVQSGSAEILSRMNRNYTPEEYLTLIRYAKSICPEMTFSSDIMVGFPGESEEDFQKTLELVEEVGYTQLFTFIYSPRGGTSAANLPDPATRADKTERMDRLLKLQEACVQQVSQQWIGNTYPALVEGKGRREGTVAARLDNNMLAEFEGDESLVGHTVEITIQALKGAVLTAERCR